ncbi:zinc finger matrin-type protein 2-like protein [Jimgerdemannia flammicorona]|uniref:Zinc finger matrin-type protein 2-like protein n=1 Tax=Jimgerdemannia flammicorona TaxID=994334 RepID=A0A433P8N7_9FUNG|nr:zinc finger matrin-type protein 2-like protein [Jimgerdemannia flammicorona]
MLPVTSSIVYKFATVTGILLLCPVFPTMADKKPFYSSNPQDTSFRRTWDRDEYERKARERARADREKDDDEDRKLKGLAPKSRSSSNRPNPPRDLLKAREEKVVLDANLNKTQVVQSAAGLASKQPGYYCKVCDCTVKDSVNYLDHINGKKHQKAMGMSMRVEKSTVDQVKERLLALKRKAEQTDEKEYDLDARIEAAKREEEEGKRRRKERKKQKREEERGGKESDVPATEEDDEMAKLMGFGGFKTSKT